MISYEHHKAQLQARQEYVDATLNSRFRAIVAAIPAGARVLDIACGSGTLMAALRDKGCHCRGIDLAPAAIALARAKGLDVVESDADAFEKEASIADLMFADHDVVIFSKCLMYLKRKNELMRRLTRPRSIIINQANPNYWRRRRDQILGRQPDEIFDYLPYVAADGREIEITSTGALRRWGESYGFRSRLLKGGWLRGRDMVIELRR